LTIDFGGGGGGGGGGEQFVGEKTEMLTMGSHIHSVTVNLTLVTFNAGPSVPGVGEFSSILFLPIKNAPLFPNVDQEEDPASITSRV
jgi:hypothetical protein